MWCLYHRNKTGSGDVMSSPRTGGGKGVTSLVYVGTQRPGRWWLTSLPLEMVNGLHLYSAFIQSAVQFKPLIHPFTHTFTHQRRLAAMQGTNQLVRSNRGLGVLLRDTSTCPGWDRTGNPPTARRQLLPPEPYRYLNTSSVSAKVPVYSLPKLVACSA